MTDKIALCKPALTDRLVLPKGIVCGLTDEKPTFELNCPDYNKDLKQKKKLAERKQMEAAELIYEEDGKSTPAWRILVGVLIFLVAVIRLAVRCSDY